MKLFNRDPKPVAEGYLPEEDGHKVYWARYGNVNGETIINFHGGPGGKSKFKHIKMIDLKKFNIIVFDQRGCGKSKPCGRLEKNNTDKLIKDAKRILDSLKIKKVIVKGGSWGSTLALLFSEKYSKMVSKIIVSAVFLGKIEDEKWLFEDTCKLYPDMHEKMLKDKPKNKNLADYYLSLILSNKEQDVIKAMNNFGGYERCVGSLDININGEADLTKVNSTKIFLHYMKNNYFIKDDEILKNIKSIENKQCLIIHNRLDLICPIVGAFNLHKAMKKSKLIINPKLGHGIEWNKEAKQQIAEFLEK